MRHRSNLQAKFPLLGLVFDGLIAYPDFDDPTKVEYTVRFASTLTTEQVGTTQPMEQLRAIEEEVLIHLRAAEAAVRRLGQQ